MNKYFFVLLGFFQLYSCSAPQKSIRKIQGQQAFIAQEDSSLSNKLKNGLDFIGSGNHPEKWSLEMDFDESISFYFGNNLSIHATPVNPIEFNQNTQIYYCVSGNEKMTISLNKSSTQNKRAVEIITGGKSYTGEGKFLRNYLLNDEWELEKNAKYNLDSTIKLPTITFNLINNTLRGFDGIKKFKGVFEEKGNYIKFKILSKNNKAVKPGSFADIFWNHIHNHEIEFIIQKDKLVLILNDDSRIVLKKKW